jgi:hypothetical protein
MTRGRRRRPCFRKYLVADLGACLLVCGPADGRFTIALASSPRWIAIKIFCFFVPLPRGAGSAF